MSDADRTTGSAIAAAQVALDAIRSMARSLDRADAAARLSREMREVADEATAIQYAEVLLAYDAEGLTFGQLAGRFGVSKSLAYKIVRARDQARADREEDNVTEPSDTPERPPVAVAIVTSHAGVLLGRRNDGSPPWAFISGEIEAGESAAEAAIREVMEEAGLKIRAGGVIARRVHPKTGRSLVYLAARATDGIEVEIGDPEEIGELKWASADEADELTGGTIYEPVRQHIRQMLRNGNGGTAGK